MTFRIAAATSVLAIATLPAFAQETETPDMTGQAELVGNMGKIEANIAEAHARLFTHMLLPQDDEERQTYSEAFSNDIASVDEYLSLVQDSDLSAEGAAEIENFAAEWSEVKDLADGLTDASRDELASVDDIKAFSNAVLELDDYIDAALEAAGLPDDDDAPE
ncbi:hypothetical protein [Paracoccus tegillarcae]|uniref:Uncharacterized protein n=1 Tax=Paracoccus tegillarcae TaxID=1529068 RepID=A0A2K9EB48_9RHOB|nr:hypothetical protein [Paracoccus tegillarcae]AUH32123.1 hypothetical protein CUV01_00735 [Paracoccus tegillarcae]